MALISGTKRWRLEVRGRVPPGVADDLMKANAMACITVTASILPWCDGVEVFLVDDEDVPSDAKGGRIVKPN